MNKPQADATAPVGSISWRQVLIKGGAEVGVELTTAMVDQLTTHAKQLAKWNRRISLTAVTKPLDVALKHFIDSLSIIPYLDDNKAILDIGSGGGFPGLPLAVARPELEVTMVDAVAKKVSFLKTVIRELAIPNCRARHYRVAAVPNSNGDDNPRRLGRFDAVVSRALADPEWCLRLAMSHLTPEGTVLMMQGRVEQGVASSLRALFRKFQPQHKITVEIHPVHLPFLQATRHLVVIKT